MFKIGTFSKLMQVSVRMLRHYDETGLLRPARIDPATGYRFYSPGQITRLRRILFLRDVGFGIAEMQPALDAWDSDEAAAARLLAGKRQAAASEMERLRARIDKLDMGLRDMAESRLDTHAEVAIKSVPGCPVLSLRRRLPDYYAEGTLWKELAAFSAARDIPVTGEAFSIYHDPDYREQDVDVELCAVVTALGKDEGPFTFRRTEAVPIMASALVHGPFERIAGAYLAMARWLSRHKRYDMEGTSRQIVHRGPWNAECPEDYVTEMQIPLKLREITP